MAILVQGEGEEADEAADEMVDEYLCAKMHLVSSYALF